MRRTLPAFVAFMLLAQSAGAATFLVQPDEVLVRSATAVATGTVAGGHVRRGAHGRIETVTRLVVDEAIKGSVAAGETIELVQTGGFLDGSFLVQSGAPVYERGARYLVFLARNRSGDWTTLDLVLGQFRFAGRDRDGMLVRDGAEIHGWFESGEAFRDRDRLAGRFLTFIRQTVNGEAGDRNYFADGTAAPSGDVPQPVPTAQFDLRAYTENAVEEWDSDSTSAMKDSVSATPASGSELLMEDCQSRIIAGDPHDEVPGTIGAGGQVVASATSGCADECGGCVLHLKNGEEFVSITAADIVINDGVSPQTLTAAQYNTTIVHEIGHTWGFRHSNRSRSDSSNCAPPLPCSKSAIMNATVLGSLNGSLQDWDRDAANEVYGDGSREPGFTGIQYVYDFDFEEDGLFAARRTGAMSWRIFEVEGCSGPAITSEPVNRTINAGESTSLSVTAVTSEGALSYQWYQGNAGVTSTPVGTNSRTLSSLSPATTTRYWVRVTDECGDGDNSEDSRAVRVTVNDTCAAPQITIDPLSQNITRNTSANLSIIASGNASLLYQWYEGAAGDVSKSVGTDSPLFTTPSLNETTQFWVRVTNSCGFDDSNTATISVPGSRRRAVRK